MNRLGLGLADGLENGFEFALRGSLVLAAAWLLTLLLTRRSAAFRHLVWAAALVAVIGLPLAQRCVPGWRILPAGYRSVGLSSVVVHDLPAPLAMEAPSSDGNQTVDEEKMSLLSQVTKRESQKATIIATEADSADTRLSTRGGNVDMPPVASDWSQGGSAVVAIWLVGALLNCLPLLLGTIRVWQLHRASHTAPSLISEEVRRLASDLGISRRIDVAMTTERAVPMTWGVYRPVLLLPTSASEWSSERRRMVLVHELAHVRRMDCLTQVLGQFARAMHWFNPLAWLAVNRLRVEQEQACDDVVLNSGADANQYAAELLSLTARLSQPTWDAAVALAMSRCNRIEQRLKSILDPDLQRRPLSPRHVLATCGVMSIVTCAVTAVERQEAKAAMPRASQIALIKHDANAADEKKAVPQIPAAEATATKQPADAQSDAAAGADDLAKHVLDKITRFSPTSVDSQALNEAAIRGMLQSLNDPYSTLMTTEQTKELHEQLKGKLVGIGAALKQEAGAIEVISVMPNSPALQGGLKPRDVILEIEGQPAKNVGDAVKQIRGPAGTEVTLKIRRADKTESLTLKRAEVLLPTVKGLSLNEQGKWRHWLDEDQKIAYVQITQFDHATPQDLHQTLLSLKEQGLQGLILDLRGNIGGLLVSCDATARLFLKEGTIVEVRGRQPQENTKVEIPTGHVPLLAETPLIVLIDPTTASAGEILAAALKDNHRATLLGERTFGKGSVQSIMPLGNDGPSLKLTTALIFSPSGKPLQRLPDSKSWGVDPHDGYFVPLTTEQRAMRARIVLARETGALLLEAAVSPEFLEKGAADAQLAAALKSMSAKLKTGEFAKSGRLLTDQEADLTQRNSLLRQRDELRAKLEQVDRQLGESN